jgi:hypothetical protein
MIFATTSRERKILALLVILLALGWLGLWLF